MLADEISLGLASIQIGFLRRDEYHRGRRRRFSRALHLPRGMPRVARRSRISRIYHSRRRFDFEATDRPRAHPNSASGSHRRIQYARVNIYPPSSGCRIQLNFKRARFSRSPSPGARPRSDGISFYSIVPLYPIPFLFPPPFSPFRRGRGLVSRREINSA